jgi:hypothetical protein
MRAGSPITLHTGAATLDLRGFEINQIKAKVALKILDIEQLELLCWIRAIAQDSSNPTKSHNVFLCTLHLVVKLNTPGRVKRRCYGDYALEKAFTPYQRSA